MNRKLLAFGIPILGIVWVSGIYFSSTKLITIPQLATIVTILTNGQVSVAQFEIVWYQIWWIFVKGWHATEFGIIYLICRKLLVKSRILPIVIAALCGVLDELHQVSIPGRGGRISDMVIDCMGIFAAWLIVDQIQIRKKSHATYRKLSIISLVMISFIWFSALYFCSEFTFGNIRF